MMSDRKCIKIHKPVWKELKHRATEHETSINDIIKNLLNDDKTYTRAQKSVAQQRSQNTASPTRPKIPSTMEKTYKIGQHLVARYNQVSRKEIDTSICKVAGADPRTITQYFNLLVDEKVLVPNHKEGRVRVWKVNHVGGWLPYHVKEYPKNNT